MKSKRRTVLALDRPIPYWEAVNRPRTYDYDLSVIVLDVDEENKGTGVMAIGVKLELENYSSEPVRPINVSKR